MDDNVRNQSKVGPNQVVKLLEVVRDTKHLYKSKEIVLHLIGRVNAVIKRIELILFFFRWYRF
jgi:ATP-dependent DNA helicase RecQ